MKPPRFRYEDPATVDEALALLASHGDGARVLAGGQSLVPMLNFRLARPSHLIDINRVAALATVTAKGEPRISGVDGHFLHGKWHFGTARSAAKARHLAARPAASVAHLRGEDLGVFTHGTVEILNPEDRPAAPDWPYLLAYFQDFYGADAFDWDREVVYYRLHPHWMTVYAPDVAKLIPS